MILIAARSSSTIACSSASIHFRSARMGGSFGFAAIMPRDSYIDGRFLAREQDLV